MKFYVCEHCGNIIEYHKNKGVPVMCCGQKMTLMEPGTTDASREKHVPVIEQDGRKVIVKIGEAEHPMVEVHYIEWIILETTNGYQKKHLQPNQAPVAEFILADGEEVVAAYEYCNLHGLWKK